MIYVLLITVVNAVPPRLYICVIDFEAIMVMHDLIKLEMYKMVLSLYLKFECVFTYWFRDCLGHLMDLHV